MTKFLFVGFIVLWFMLTIYVAFLFGYERKVRKIIKHERERQMWLRELRARVAAANEREG